MPDHYVMRSKEMKGKSPPPWGSYHYFGEHMFYNKTEVNRILGPGATHIASIRNPFSLLRGIFQEWGERFLKFHLGLPKNDPSPMKTYVRHIEKYKDKESVYVHTIIARMWHQPRHVPVRHQHHDNFADG